MKNNKSVKKRKKKRILAVCHDAGGAELVSAYVKKNIGRYDFACAAFGPAEKIFKRKKIGKLAAVRKKSPLELLHGAKGFSMVLTGTSWGSSIELDFIKEAKLRGVKSAAYLDHWTNYRERFGYPRKNWRENLPDEIWVGDKYALKIAYRNFKKIKIKFSPNLYFKEIKENCEKRVGVKPAGILFLSEPVGGSVNCFGDADKKRASEFEILKMLLDFCAGQKIKNRIIIRLHPSEKTGKYDKIISKYAGKLIIGKSNLNNLVDDIARAEIVIGMESMAIVVSLMRGKKTASFLPHKNIRCPLPFPGIIKLKTVKQLADFIS